MLRQAGQINDPALRNDGAYLLDVVNVCQRISFEHYQVRYLAFLDGTQIPRAERGARAI